MFASFTRAHGTDASNHDIFLIACLPDEIYAAIAHIITVVSTWVLGCVAVTMVNDREDRT